MDWLGKLFSKDKKTGASGPAAPGMAVPVPPERLEAFFNDAARDEEHFPSSIDPQILHVRLIVEYLGDCNGKIVADIGCGKGRFARIVKDNNPGALVVAIDIAEAMLARVPPDIAACAGTLAAIPLATASCDGVYATESLEHAVDIEGAVAELCRVLKPGGRLVIIDKNKEKWGRFETPEWEKWFGREELESLLRRHCRTVESQFISYWEDEVPDGLFIAWKARK